MALLSAGKLAVNDAISLEVGCRLCSGRALKAWMGRAPAVRLPRQDRSHHGVLGYEGILFN